MNGRASDDERMKLWDEISGRVDKSRLVAVQLTKGNEGFGFTIHGGVNHPHVGSDPGIFITAVRAYSPAAVDGRLEKGDRILAVNATSLECVTHHVAANEIRNAKEPVWLLLEKNAEAQLLGQASHDERKKLWDELSRGVDKSRLVGVHLMKGKTGLGFSIRESVDQSCVSSDPGIFIRTVSADSPAAADGRLEPGDRILAVNATNLECVTLDVAVNEFRKAEESVWLLLEKNAEAQLLTQQVPNSPEETVTDGSPILGPCEEEPPNPTFGLLKQFYESKLDALSNGSADCYCQVGKCCEFQSHH